MILHHYSESPFAEKVRVLLGLKGLSWGSFEVPAINKNRITSTITGGYRKIPVLQIGCDFYCDTTLIVREIQTRYQTPDKLEESLDSLGFISSIFFDKIIFTAAVSQISFNGIKNVTLEQFVEDRIALIGSGNAFGGARVPGKSKITIRDQILSNLSQVEDLLKDGREFLLHKTKPTILDASAYAQIGFLKTGKFNFLQDYPLLSAWVDRVKRIGQGGVSDVTEVDVLNAIKEAQKIKYSGKIYEKEKNPSLTLMGSQISIRPDDVGDFEVSGKLIGSTQYSICIERFDETTKGNVRVHFPRTGYFVYPSTTTESKL